MVPGGDLPRVRAVVVDLPEHRLEAVGDPVDLDASVGHRLAVGADGRRGDALELEKAIEGEGPLRLQRYGAE